MRGRQREGIPTQLANVPYNLSLSSLPCVPFFGCPVLMLAAAGTGPRRRERRRPPEDLEDAAAAVAAARRAVNDSILGGGIALCGAHMQTWVGRRRGVSGWVWWCGAAIFVFKSC